MARSCNSGMLIDNPIHGFPSLSGTWPTVMAYTHQRKAAAGGHRPRSALTAPLPLRLLVDCWVATWEWEKKDDCPPALWGLSFVESSSSLGLSPLRSICRTHPTPHYLLIVMMPPQLHCPSPSAMTTLINRWWTCFAVYACCFSSASLFGFGTINLCFFMY